jgi:hypothetical protein
VASYRKKLIIASAYETCTRRKTLGGVASGDDRSGVATASTRTSVLASILLLYIKTRDIPNSIDNRISFNNNARANIALPGSRNMIRTFFRLRVLSSFHNKDPLQNSSFITQLISSCHFGGMICTAAASPSIYETVCCEDWESSHIHLV